jgi:GAF domain-containing protein
MSLEPHIRFYAGYPLKDSRGYILGTLCVLDRVPRQFQQQELDLLYDLAQMVEREMNLAHTQITISPQWQQSHRFCARFDDATINMTLLNTI